MRIPSSWLHASGIRTKIWDRENKAATRTISAIAPPFENAHVDTSVRASVHHGRNTKLRLSCMSILLLVDCTLRSYWSEIRNSAPYLRLLKLHDGLWTCGISRVRANTTIADQTPPHRRLRRRQILLPSTIQRRLLHTLFHHDNRHRLQDTDNRARWQAGETANMGHSRPRTVQDDHHGILQRSDGYPISIRCDR